MSSEFMRKKFSKVWWKFYGRVAKAAFYVSRTMFLGKTILPRSSFFTFFFDFQENVSNFRKRFLSGLLKKYSVCPEDRNWEDKFTLKPFYISNSPSFLDHIGKISTFGERYSAKLSKCNLGVQRIKFRKTIVLWKKNFSSFLDFLSNNIRKLPRKVRKVVNTQLYVSSGTL